MGTSNSLSDGERFVAIHDSTRFTALRHQYRRFAAPASVVFIGWWVLASLLGAYAPGFYRQTVIASVNVGMLVVLGTFVLVLVIAAMYLRYARTQLDPAADQIRADAEGGTR
ncbi:DUF485 domain-containing protein [Dactylosporangium sp. NPDC050688]|uniref:DUF485 domain-containing protein n=1 Tax=Dactylosporangium sp. NPDC050688 TaxID=3157217 RepID=UPI0033DFF84E